METKTLMFICAIVNTVIFSFIIWKTRQILEGVDPLNLKLKKGDRVVVKCTGENCSELTDKDPDALRGGVYSVPDWYNKVYRIGGDLITCIDVHESLRKTVKGAYPVCFDGELIGYVYNTGLKKV